MNSDLTDTLDLLRRVLLLERKQGYRNTSATGGLHRYFRQRFAAHDYDEESGALAEGMLRALKRYEETRTVPERAQQVEVLLRRLDATASSQQDPAPPIGPVSPAHRGDSAALARVRGQHPSPPNPLSLKGRGGDIDAALPGTPGVGKALSAPQSLTPQPPLPHAGEGELGSSYLSLASHVTQGSAAASPSEARGRASRSNGKAAQSSSSGSKNSQPAANDAGHSQSAGETATGLPSPLEGEGSGVRGVATSLDQPLADVLKIRAQEREKLERLGIRTVEDALYHLPRDHYDCRNPLPIHKLRLGMTTTLIGTLKEVNVRRTARNHAIVEAKIADATAMIRVSWFNQQHVAHLLRPHVGQRIAVSGHTELYNGRLQFVPRDYEFPDEDGQTHTNGLVPVYPLTEGLTQRWLRSAIRRTLDAALHLVEDPLPEALRRAHKLPSLAGALAAYHFPDDDPAHHLSADDKKKAAMRRLAFDELLCISIGMARRKRTWQEGDPARVIPRDADALARFLAGLPFALTGAQQRALDTILDAMSRPTPMSLLLQGDVGSGKTVVAAAALAMTVGAGLQGAIMAPTEILAEQHARSLSAMLAPLGIEVALLTGSVKGAARKRVYAGAADGSIPVVVGTHAVIQEGVVFDRLGLAVVDEQHRFGVEQRASLRQKGYNPHLLAMTATPIPRTLSLTIYGDLDVAVIDERPPGRQPVETEWLPSEALAWRLVREQVARGRQAFVICPLVEETDKSDARAAVAEQKRLQREVFPDLAEKIGLLHGKMKPADKEKILAQFRDGQFDVLVATSVVEVGIDVPNATVMVIEEANRFGLAQLHQFRGRVGRSAERSYCVLLAESASAVGQQRLQAITSTDDGFKLAEVDLELRGPGEFWGTRQSGLPEMRVAGLGDVRTIEEARDAAESIVAVDPDLNAPEHALLAGRVERFWNRSSELS